MMPPPAAQPRRRELLVVSLLRVMQALTATVAGSASRGERNYRCAAVLLCGRPRTSLSVGMVLFFFLLFLDHTRGSLPVACVAPTPNTAKSTAAGCVRQLRLLQQHLQRPGCAVPVVGRFNRIGIVCLCACSLPSAWSRNDYR